MAAPKNTTPAGHAVQRGQVWRMPPQSPAGAPQAVEVMAVSDGYAMVRFPGCAPWVAAVERFDGWTLDLNPGEWRERRELE